LIWFNNIDVDTFYPRCFDLGLLEETDDFITDFKATKASNYLKIYLREIREANDSGAQLVSLTVNDKLLRVAMDVCTRRVRDLDDLIDDPTAFG
jgi:tubulin monoglycylase TTLL3/8